MTAFGTKETNIEIDWLSTLLITLLIAILLAFLSDIFPFHTVELLLQTHL